LLSLKNSNKKKFKNFKNAKNHKDTKNYEKNPQNTLVNKKPHKKILIKLKSEKVLCFG
jgi:hypothetical protein